MTDTLEHDVKAMLERKLGELHATPVPPVTLLRRARRRQVSSVVMGVLTSVAVVAGAVIGVRSALNGNDHNTVPAGQVTTTTVQGVTITYPTGWRVRDLTTLPGQQASSPPMPLLALANFDVSERTFACPALDPAIPADAAVLVVLDSGSAGPSNGFHRWPVQLKPVKFSADQCSRAWTSYQASWATRGRAFHGTVSLGPDVSDEVRTAILDAFASMRFSPVERPTDMTVIRTGMVDGTRWTVRVRPGANASPSLEWETEGAGSASGSSSAASGPPRTMDLNARRVGKGSDAIVVLFGLVRENVVRVAVRGTTISADAVPLPDRFTAKLKTFVLEAPATTTGHVVALDSAGNVVAEKAIAPANAQPAPAGSSPGTG